MRKKIDETLEEWAQRVQTFELLEAKKALAQGQDAHVVMEAMATRIQKKIMHALYKSIQDSVNNNSIIQTELSRQRYEELYLNKNKPKPDQSLEDK
jgi:glutamyl-tRNA reductase